MKFLQFYNFAVKGLYAFRFLGDWAGFEWAINAFCFAVLQIPTAKS